MKTIINITIIGLSLLVLGGCEANGRFDVKSSVAGSFATTTAKTTEKNGHYSIRLDTVTKGLFNLVKGKQTESYRSTGRIRNGLYYSELYTIERWTSKLHSINNYTIDYKRHKVNMHYREWHGKKLVKETKKSQNYTTHDDFLTIGHNVLYKAKRTSGSGKTYRVAGAEESNGKVSVYISNDATRLKRWGAPTNGTLLQLGIKKGMFTGGKGSMTVLLDAKKNPLKIVIQKVKMAGIITITPKK